MGQRILSNLLEVGLYGAKVGVPFVVQQAESNARHSLHGAFDGGGHGSAVNHVDAGVAAVVDPAHDEVGLAVLEHLMHGQLDTVHGGSAAGVLGLRTGIDAHRLQPE